MTGIDPAFNLCETGACPRLPVEQLTTLLPRDNNKPLNESQLEIALILARIQLDRAEPAYAAADEILSRV